MSKTKSRCKGPIIGPEKIEAVIQVFKSDWLSMGVKT